MRFLINYTKLHFKINNFIIYCFKERKISLKNDKGISKIVVTVILVSICLVIAIAVAAWISGTTERFMKNDKIEIVYSFAKRNDDHFFISIEFKNIGETIVRVRDTTINGKPFKKFAPETSISLSSTKASAELDPSNEGTFIPIYPGEVGKIDISIPSYATSAGQTIHITIHTVNGGEFHVPLILE